MAMARGGARGCPCPSETSASGATAVGVRGSASRLGYFRRRTPPAIRLKNRLPSFYCRCRSSPPIMLEHLSSLPTQMDYKGQKLAEQMFQGIILFSAVVGFIYGYVAEQFGWTVYIVMAGFAFSCLVKGYCKRRTQARSERSSSAQHGLQDGDFHAATLGTMGFQRPLPQSRK